LNHVNPTDTHSPTMHLLQCPLGQQSTLFPPPFPKQTSRKRPHQAGSSYLTVLAVSIPASLPPVTHPKSKASSSSTQSPKPSSPKSSPPHELSSSYFGASSPRSASTVSPAGSSNIGPAKTVSGASVPGVPTG